jgi:predicted TPR repeat methyltransferase
MTEGWDEFADGWDSNRHVIAYSEKAFKSILDAINIDGSRVLDFGCGTGLLTERISPLVKEVVALDSSEKMILVLASKELSNVTTVSGELSDSRVMGNKLFSEKFDLIVASSVCSFLSEYEATLALLKSLLVRGGIFVQWDWLAEDSDSDFGLSQEKVTSAHHNAGLELQALKQVFSIENSEGDMPVLMGIARNA